MSGVVPQQFVSIREERLVVLYHAHVGTYRGLAVSECIEGVDSLVGGYVVVEVDDNLGDLGGKVFHFLDFYFPAVVRFQYAVYQYRHCLPVWDFTDDEGLLVEFLDVYAHPDTASAVAFVVFRAVCGASCRKIRIQFEVFPPEAGYGCVDEVVEIVGKDFRGESDGYPLGSLGEQKREFGRKFDRFLVSAVV